ncbi:hypothetical protein QUF63_01975 [Anaerolineales bacterium HSG25]|nr:hypothetical protein [Anaerolineales bacterium HSG25]
MSKSKRAETVAKPTVSPILILGIAAIIAVLLGAVLIFWDTANPQPTSRTSTDETEFPTKGDPDAPVTITEFSDYG